MSNYFLISSLFIVQILILCMLYKYHRTIIHPTVIFQSYFSVQIFIALLIFREYDFKLYGVIWIIIALFLFSLGGLFYSGITTNLQRKRYTNNLYTINFKLAKLLLIICIALGCLYSVEFFIKNGISFRTLFDIDALLDLNHEVAVERYSSKSSGVSITSRIFLVFLYLSPLIGGFNYNFLTDKKGQRLCLLSVSPALLVLLTKNTKSTLIAAVLLFISGYLVSSAKLNKSLPKITITKVRNIFISIITFISIMYASMMMRVGRFDVTLINTMNNKLINYALGHVAAFDIWFSNMFKGIDYNFGTRTFYGIADFLGISIRSQGIYSDRVYWSRWTTNVYTMFRPLIEDFGPYLTLGIMFFWGFFMSFIFNQVKNKDNSKGIVILAAFYFYVGYGFITSVWAYMSYTLVFIFFSLYVIVTSKRKCKSPNEGGAM